MARVLCVLAIGLWVCVLGSTSAERLSKNVILKAVSDAKKLVDDAYTYSRAETLRRVKKHATNPGFRLRLLKQPSRDARSAVRSADYFAQTMELLHKRHHVHRRSLNATDLLNEEDLETIERLTGCAARVRKPNCNTVPHLNKYRTATGLCNNIANPRRGASNTPFARWLPAEYQDGVSLPQTWNPITLRNGALLPLVREVSNRIVATRFEDIVEDNVFSHMLTFFGQWTDHDLTLTPTSPSIVSFNGGINCDESCDQAEPCFPILLPPNDVRRGKNSHGCIPFFQSAPACGTGNTGHIFGAATEKQQLNVLTSYLDAGQVYGADDKMAMEVRDLTSAEGLLRVNQNFTDNGRHLLPFGQTDMCANRPEITGDENAENVPCFLAGEERVVENMALTALHTVMMREHNRLARALAHMNPHWSGETLFQEARKIIGGYHQVITFRDYLGPIVGPDMMKALGPYPGYDEDVDPTAANVFATAAFRYAHPAIQPFMFRLDERYQEHPKFPSVLMSKNFFTPWRVVFEGGVDPIIRGLIGRPAKLNTQDTLLHDELRERLFRFVEEVTLDLSALNMQRGRDHGLPGYNSWRKFCGLSQPRTVEELAVVLNNKELARSLLELYGTADNIDVWLGGVAEPFVRGGRVGPLFACLIARQFQSIRVGDRLWWENKGVFTDAQRESLKSVSLARIICDNTGILSVPERVFEYRPDGSGFTSCQHIPTFDLSPWKDNSMDQGQLHVGFVARLGNYGFPHSGKPIAFRSVVYNYQDAYNAHTGVFTCKQPGVYQFNFFCKLFLNVGTVSLHHNGRVVQRSLTLHQGGHATATGATVLPLVTGDTVYLTANFLHAGNGLTTDSSFSGHLLF
ncbi:eosinophil peroxidase-like [Engraulis encrasicolus]|uniref:eosinophil peroxidase-like n=1 Tax=Engraulis encrasicolus TaxID=184585 RepID=UPI002FD01254